MHDPTELARLLDERAIERLLTHYCTLIDAKAFERLGEVFTADAVIDYTASGGIRGRLDEVARWLGEALAPFVVVQHMVSNFVIEVADDEATSLCYFHNPMGMPAGDGRTKIFWCGGRYRDVLVRESGGWRIRERINEMLYMQGPGSG